MWSLQVLQAQDHMSAQVNLVVNLGSLKHRVKNLIVVNSVADPDNFAPNKGF